MTLKPCKVCGTLNSHDTDICLSCGYPPQGRQQPLIFTLTAIGLATFLALPPLLSLIQSLPAPDSPPTQPDPP